VLREIVQMGFTQVQVANLVQRHKAWVSRRIGLVERLHPELVEDMRLGLLSPGVARRLLSLPPGNQLQIAAAAQSAGLGLRDTERLVSLWHSAKEPEIQRQLLAEPRASLAQAFPENAAVDARLTPQGQQLSRLLRLVAGVAPRLSRLLPRGDVAWVRRERWRCNRDRRSRRTRLILKLKSIAPCRRSGVHSTVIEAYQRLCRRVISQALASPWLRGLPLMFTSPMPDRRS